MQCPIADTSCMAGTTPTWGCRPGRHGPDGGCI